VAEPARVESGTLDGSGERPVRATARAATRIRTRESAATTSLPPGDEREVRASVRRLRSVLGVGLLLWNLIGVPNDVQVTETFGLSYDEFTRARVISSAVQLVGWSLLFLPGLGRRGLRVAEAMCFVGTSAGLAALNHGIAGPTPLFLSCALLAQGASVPRPWREGLASLGTTFLTYPLALLWVESMTARNAGQWADPSMRFAFLSHLFSAACTLVFVVVAGDALHGLRRRALAAERIGRYRLVERLGGGAMGEVWRARHPGLEQDVALKLATSPAAEARLVEEAAMLSELTHPSTVRLTDRGRDGDGRFYFAMELLRGVTLASLVERDGPLDPARTRELGVALTGALAEAHAHRIVHRDLKPENVMIGEGAFVKLLDFGVATRLDRPGAPTEGIVGSPRFMAPEQRRGAALDPRADVFGVAAVLAFARTGKGPIDAEEGPDLRALEPARRALEASGVPVDAVIAHALAAEPDARPASMDALRDRLLDAAP
jgi:hypothetical protein